MKKLFYIFAAVAVTMWACQKPNAPEQKDDQKPDDKPATQDVELVLSTPEIVDVEAESGIYNIKFKSTEAWTASVLNAPENAVVLGNTSGEAGDDIQLKVTYGGLGDGEVGRLFDVSILAGEKVRKNVTFFQGKVFIVDKEETPQVGLGGGEVVYGIRTNMEYSVKKYDGAEEAFPWAPVTVTESDHLLSIAFNVAKNEGFDPRSCYVKVTVTGLAEDDSDEVVRLYVEQEGTIKVAWTQNFIWTMFPEGTRESISEVGDYFIINSELTSQSTGGAHVFKKSDGSFVKTLDIPSCTGITNDDAGNIIVSVGGNYPIDESTWALDVDNQIPLQIFVFTKAEAATIIESGTLPNKSPILTYSDGFYGYGLDNIRVNGDATSDAVITMCTSGGYGDFYAVDWEIKGGAFVDPGNGYTAYTELPNFLPTDYSMGIWSSFDIVAKHTGTTSSSPLYYMGYDNNYNLQYLSGKGAEWQEVFVTGGEGNEGYCTFSIAEWNGHKYLSFISLPYFAWADWDGDEVIDDNLPGTLWLLNIDDPVHPVLESSHQYYCDPENWQYGNSCDVKLVVEGSDLVAYVVDAAASLYMKVVYPAK